MSSSKNWNNGTGEAPKHVTKLSKNSVMTFTEFSDHADKIKSNVKADSGNGSFKKDAFKSDVLDDATKYDKNHVPEEKDSAASNYFKAINFKIDEKLLEIDVPEEVAKDLELHNMTLNDLFKHDRREDRKKLPEHVADWIREVLLPLVRSTDMNENSTKHVKMFTSWLNEGKDYVVPEKISKYMNDLYDRLKAIPEGAEREKKWKDTEYKKLIAQNFAEYMKDAISKEAIGELYDRIYDLLPGIFGEKKK